MRLLLSFICLVSVIGNATIIPDARRIDWSSAGIPGGIPVVNTMFVNVLTTGNATYKCYGDGVTDDYLALKNAINYCPSNQFVYVPAGTYLLSQSIPLIHSGVVVRGDGTNTVLKGKTGMTAGNDFFSVAVNGYDWNMTGTTAYDISSGYTKGSTSITTSSAHGWAIGDYVVIDELTNTVQTLPVDSRGTLGNATWLSRSSGQRCVGQTVKILTVSGSDATFSPSLNWEYSSGNFPQAIKIRNPIVMVGIENLQIDNGDSNVKYSLSFYFGVNCWATNVDILGVRERGIEVYGGLQNQIDGCIIREGIPIGSTNGSQYGSSHAYGVFLGGYCPTAMLVQNNIMNNLSLGVSLEGGPSGCVVAYNYIHRLFYTETNTVRNAIIHHGGHPNMNLIEGNIVDWGLISMDAIWGTSSHSTVFRNRVAQPTYAGYRYYRFNMALFQRTREHNIIGNVLGNSGYESVYERENETFTYTDNTPGIYALGYADLNALGAVVINNVTLPWSINDPAVKTSLLRHGNYDYVNSDTLWDETIADHTLPASYYLNSKPAWFGSVAWPPIGSDLTPLASKIPAQLRFENGSDPLAVPAITGQPASITRLTGTSASFSVVASGYPTPAFQWKKATVDIGGATSSTYTIPTVAIVDAGSYTVYISNSQGNVTSSAAVLTVTNSPVTISVQPTGSTIAVGGNYTFTVTLSTNVTPPITYQWFHDNVSISNGTNTTYSVASAVPNDAGNYYVNVTNPEGTVSSTTNRLGISPSITVQPAPSTLWSGATASFSVTATGAATLTYQWYKVGTGALSGKTTSSLSIPNCVVGDSGTYYVIVTNSDGTAQSSSVVLTINGAPALEPYMSFRYSN